MARLLRWLSLQKRLRNTRVRPASNPRSVPSTCRFNSRPILEELEGRTLLSASILDAGFESPAIGTGSFQYDPVGTPWTFSGGAGVSSNGSGFTSGNSNAPEGTQVAFVQATGSISQSVEFAPGTYVVSFQAARRANYNTGLFHGVTVIIDGNTV